MAAAAALLADLARRSLIKGARGSGTAWRGAVAMVAGLTWAAAPAVWGQATIAEVYALNALFCVALLWTAWRWGEGTGSEAPQDSATEGGHRRALDPPLLAGGLLLGLALGNHLTAALMLPGLALWFGAKARRDPALRVALARALPGALGLAALGLGVYATLPLAARAMPPVNWGDPQTLAGLAWVAAGRLYASMPFGLPLADLPARLAGFAGEAAQQLGGAWGMALALLGLWRLDHRDRDWLRATLLIALAFAIYAIDYNTTDSFVYLLPMWAVAALWLAEAFGWMVERAQGRPALAAVAVALGLTLLPGVSIARNWSGHDLSRDREARAFVQATLREAAPDAVILSVTDRPTFALWYAVYGLRLRPDLAPLNLSLFGFDWYRRTVAANHADLPLIDPAAPEAWIAAVATERPVYAAEDLELELPGLLRTPAGVLTKLTPARDADAP
jgi:hypothetical protein